MSRTRGLRSGRQMLLPALAATALTAAACTDEPADEPATAEEYRAALAAICTAGSDVLDALPSPPDEVTVAEFASSVSSILTDEAERTRALSPPDELDDDHRAFIRNTDDQASRWTDLSTTSPDDPAFSDLAREIGELTLGRNDLSSEMGVEDCRREPT